MNGIKQYEDNFYTMRHTVFRLSEIQITRIKKYKFQNHRNAISRFDRSTNYNSTDIQSNKLKKYNFQKWGKTNYRIREIRVTFEWIMGDFQIMCEFWIIGEF